MRWLAEVDEVGQRAGGGSAPGQGRKIPLQLDGGQDRCVVVDNRRDMARLGERRSDQARDAEPVAVVSPGLVGRNVDGGRNIVRGDGNTFNLRLHRCKIAVWPELGSRCCGTRTSWETGSRSGCWRRRSP